MRLPFFLQTNRNSQKYQVNFSVKVKNVTSYVNATDIIMPLPLQNSYQKTIGKVNFSPKGNMCSENKFQNKYIYWKQSLKPKEEKEVKLNFKVLISPNVLPTKVRGDLSKFLKSDKFVNSKIVAKISERLVKNIWDPFEKVKILNNYVLNKLEYGNPIKGLYSTDDALKLEKVDCGGFNMLLISLCISQKIPARLVSGFFASENNNMHAWVEIFIPNKGWITADPSIEKLSKEGRTKRKATLGNIPADRIALSVGQDFNLNLAGKNIKLDILQNPFVVAQNGENSIKVESEFKAHKI